MAPFAAVARDPDHWTFLFRSTDGAVYSTYWDSASGWAWWFRIDDEFAEAATLVTVVASTPAYQ